MQLPLLFLMHFAGKVDSEWLQGKENTRSVFTSIVYIIQMDINNSINYKLDVDDFYV